MTCVGKIWGRSRDRLLVAAVVVLLGGCGMDMGSLNPFSSEEDKLPGKRVDILTDTDPITVEAGAPSSVRLGSARANSEWSQPGGNAANAPGHLSLNSGLSRGFRVNAGRGASKKGRPTFVPVVAGSRIYVMDTAGRVNAHSTAGGARIWSASLVPEGEKHEPVSGGGLAFDNGRLFVASAYGEMIAFDAGSGQRVWSKKLGIPARGAPTAANGAIFLVGADNRVFALSQNDGEELWSYRGIPEASGLLVNASPAVADGMVVVPYSSGEIIAFKSKDGEPAWADSLLRSRLTTSLSGISDVAARPVIDRGQIFAVSVSGRLVASRLRSGERQWSRNIASAQTPAVSESSIFLVTLDGRLIALSRKTGKAQWATQLPKDEDNRLVWAGPVLAGSRLWLTASDGQLVGVDPVTGKLAGKLNVREEIFLPPIVAGGRLYVLTDKANLISYH